MYRKSNKIIIVGATSGIGYEVAQLFCRAGWKVGIAGRRGDKLEEFKATVSSEVETECIDVTHPDATFHLQSLIDRMGGMDIFFLSSGVGSQNYSLQPAIELQTIETNAAGFTRMVTFAWNFFKQQKGGHIAVISSIAGTKGLGAAPAYSATKRFQNTYIDALEQLAYMEKLPICFTDIRPGFVRTALLKDKHYPLLMKPERVAATIQTALLKKKRRVVIDWRYRILVFFWRLVPACIWKRLPIRN